MGTSLVVGVCMRLNPKKVIELYWFSGTGNTLYIAKIIEELLGKNGFAVNLEPIENTTPASVDINNTIGLAFPVAEQGTYPFIWEFINNLPSPSEDGLTECDVFMVDTLMLYSGGMEGYPLIFRSDVRLQ